MSNENKKKGFFLTRWFKRWFGPRQEMSALEEEQLQSPIRTIIKNFTGKKLSMFGLIGFLAVFLLVLIAPNYLEMDLGYQDSTLSNIPPTMNMMKVPSELKGNVKKISPGTTFAIGVDNDGEVYSWGYTNVAGGEMAHIPEEVQNAHIVDIAAGYDHAVALDDQGELYVWGNTRLQQDMFSPEMRQAMMKGGDAWNIVQLEASNQFSAVVTADGNLYLWGNGNMADIKVRKSYQGRIKKVALTGFAYVVLLDDGTVAYAGYKDKDSVLAKLPAALEGKKVVDIAATSQNAAAVTEDGQVVVWGNTTKGEKDVPELSSKPIDIYGGRYHYTVLCENGDVFAWGDNTHGQSEIPASVNAGGDIVNVYAGFFQNYAITSTGDIKTWGLRGYLCGTDDLGRDILTRIVHGGLVTMTVGALAVLISTVIGIVLGGLAGYFGGAIDMVVMRIAEVVGGLPFIPFAMILSAVLGSRVDTTQRMYIIMVVLGVLSWPSICRLVRAQILAEREKEFVTAAKAMGVKEGVIVFKHILPNVISILLVSMTLDFATCMLTESTLSYLGFGIPLPTPTWGNMLTGANNSIIIQQYWWRWVFPAAICGFCTICINLIGDGLRDAIDPKSAER
ncbi:MAG: ABC transporter permease subunit [Lachnospiraceae bacterium]|nr:ABC transporter permease subunit [Lachnospiraceae bacterium]